MVLLLEYERLKQFIPNKFLQDDMRNYFGINVALNEFKYYKEKGEQNMDLVAVLKDQVKPALGCTEPVAVGIAASTAFKKIGGEVNHITVKLSPNIFKNGMGVGIPGTNEKGLVFAVALSIVCGDPDLGLEVFKHVNDNKVVEAKRMFEKNVIDIKLEDKKSNFYIEAQVNTSNGQAICIIEDSHTNIVFIKANDEILFQKNKQATIISKKSSFNLKDLTLKKIREFIENTPSKDIAFLLDGVKLNMDIASKGLEDKAGVGLGAGINELIEEGIIQNDIVNKVRVLTSSACDARMAGVNMPVMSSAGSGNHGITAIIPVVVVCRELGCNDDQLARALAFSHLTTSYIKQFTGKLSPACGCSIAAGIGASVAIAWLYGANDEQIEGAIKNMVGSISGMVCDGAKGGCAYKLSTASSEAVIQAKLALNNIIISDLDGIVGIDAEKTIQNLGKFCNNGMKEMDKEILDIMLAQ